MNTKILWSNYTLLLLLAISGVYYFCVPIHITRGNEIGLKRLNKTFLSPKYKFSICVRREDTIEKGDFSLYEKEMHKMISNLFKRNNSIFFPKDQLLSCENTGFYININLRAGSQPKVTLLDINNIEVTIVGPFNRIDLILRPLKKLIRVLTLDLLNKEENFFDFSD